MHRKIVTFTLIALLSASFVGNIYLFQIKRHQDNQHQELKTIEKKINHSIDHQNNLQSSIDEKTIFLNTCSQDIDDMEEYINENRKLINDMTEERMRLADDISYKEDMERIVTYLSKQTEIEELPISEFPYKKEYQHINDQRVELNLLYGNNSLVIDNDMAIVMTGNKMENYSFAYQNDQEERKEVHFYKVDNTWLISIENIHVGVRGIEVIQVNHEWYYRLFVDDYKRNRLGAWKPLVNEDVLIPLYSMVEDTIKIATNIELNQLEVVNQVIPEDLLAMFPKSKKVEWQPTIYNDMITIGNVPTYERFVVRSIDYNDNNYTINAIIYAHHTPFQGTEPILIDMINLTITFNKKTNELMINGESYEE